MSTGSQPPKIACPHCGAMIKAPALAAGSSVNCPKCGQRFSLGEQETGAVQSPKSKVQGQEAVVRAQESGVVRQPVSAPPGGQVPSTKCLVPSTKSATASPPLPPSPQAQAPHRRPRSPDTVDPNLLAPPPPRVKPKPTEVAVVCQLCGTRIYVKLDKVGTEVKCPDCYSRNEVPAQK